MSVERVFLPVVLGSLFAFGCASTQSQPEDASEKEEQADQARLETQEPAPGLAAEIVQRGTLRVAMSGDQPPFNAVSRSGEYLGFEVDLASALARSIGVELEIVELPFAELLPAVEQHQVDM
ncbi:MAG: transporter substrate-binding domain-containing protein, partial [Polyangiaceae bacterium]|nr:transporter substrate-binding domain-containing protein [Polyangiaceae bacterium]